MNPLFLAAEGGYQHFTLKGGEFAVLALSGASALLAIAVGFILAKSVLAEDQGTPKMIEIATAIQEGALAYLKRQMKTIVVILVPLAVIVFLTSTRVAKPDGSIALSFVQSGLARTLAFMAGCLMSGLTGFIGMSLATQGNVRTAAAAKTGSLPAALQVAFRTGGVAGMFTVGLGLLGATIIITIFQNTSSAILVGFGFGGSLLALFLRVGGGIFTKAADVGADLVGKVEAGIPEDDPRNPATIADNVGDNVGDCAGMAADLFESYEVTLVASIILGVAAFKSIGANPVVGLIVPLIARAIGVLASIVGVFAVRATDKDKSAMAPINRGFLTAGVLTVVGTTVVALTYVGNDHANEGWKVAGAVVIGLVLAQVVSRLTEYYTSTENTPVRDIAEAARTGPATTVLSGISSGLESTVFAVIAIASAIGAVIAAVALFASFIETIGSELNVKETGSALFHHPLTQINVADPKTFIGLLIGGAVPFLFSALAIRAVGRTAGTVVQEVRRQFREHPGIMDGTEKPEYGAVIDICTAASLRELATPALLAVLTPVIIGFGISYFALGAFLAAVILTGQLMAVFLSNSGGGWDNAKKDIQDGNEGGKGSKAHEAAVIGDTVGDPFKDTAGPALNPLIKVMNLVSLLVLPAIISLRNDNVRFVIAGAALVVLTGAIAFSKRKTESLDSGPVLASAAAAAGE